MTQTNISRLAPDTYYPVILRASVERKTSVIYFD